MPVATARSAINDYIARTKTISGLREIRAGETASRLMFYTLVHESDKELGSFFRVEQEIRDAHPDTPLGFEIFNLAELDSEAVARSIPTEAKIVYRSAP
jgi:hypothetical protein